MAYTLEEFGAVVLPLVKARTTTVKTMLLDVSTAPGRIGDTINIRSPYITTGDVRIHTPADRAAGNSFIFDPVEDTVTPIQIRDFFYKGTDLDYALNTFGAADLKQLAKQSADLIARRVNATGGALLQADIDAIVSAITLDANDEVSAKIILKAMRGAKTTLDEAGVDTFERFFAVSPRVGEYLLGDDQFSHAEKAGTPDALREATIGRVYGAEVVIDNTLTGLGFVLYEQNAYGVVIRPKAKSQTNAVEAVIAIDEDSRMVLSATSGYDMNSQSDKLVVGAFVGSSKLDPARSVAVRFTEAV